MITIRAVKASGQVIAESNGKTETTLVFDHIYQTGDTIELTTDVEHLWVQMDAALQPGEVYVPYGAMTWRVPSGEHRLAYYPEAFEAKWHVISARIMSDKEVEQRRNVAANPADLRGNTNFFPHCTANIETRNEACFCARNVIDGMCANTGHGVWPFQSWGIGAREDAWCLIEFGRLVNVDEMALTLRADFPHDAYWVGGHVVLSDGTEIAYNLEKTGERQYIKLGNHQVTWMRLERMKKSDDPSAFPALVEWEIFGQDMCIESRKFLSACRGTDDMLGQQGIRTTLTERKTSQNNMLIQGDDP